MVRGTLLRCAEDGRERVGMFGVKRKEQQGMVGWNVPDICTSTG
jgi:hypothetical protein